MSLKLAGTGISLSPGNALAHQRSARPTPSTSSTKRHRPSSETRSRVDDWRGLSMDDPLALAYATVALSPRPAARGLRDRVGRKGRGDQHEQDDEHRAGDDLGARGGHAGHQDEDDGGSGDQPHGVKLG